MDDAPSPDLPDLLTTRLDGALLRDDFRAADAVLARARELGADALPDVERTFALARDLPEEEAFHLRDAAAEIVYAADVPAGYEMLVREVATRDRDDVLPDLDEIVVRHGEHDWDDVALPLRREAIDEGDEVLRAACSFLLSFSAPGTDGVLDALLDEHDREPSLGIDCLCRHDDERAAPVLLEWLRDAGPIDELDEDGLGLACDVALALTDWGVQLDRDDRARADAALLLTCEHLEETNESLREEIRANERLAAELRARVPGTPRRAGARRRVGRNAPCPCGSGKKAKACCG